MGRRLPIARVAAGLPGFAALQGNSMQMLC